MRLRHLHWVIIAIGMASPVSAQSGSVVISQVYGGGGNVGAPLRSDFIELFNRGVQPVSLAGWSVQHASATGTSWDSTDLTGTIQPGQYYLVQEWLGAVGAAPPAPDAVGGINLNEHSAKIALVKGLADFSGVGPSGPQIVDFVGYGTVNASLGSPAPLLNNVTAILRGSNGCADTNNNGGDFSVGSPSPRNGQSALHLCAPLPAQAPTISAAAIVNAASFAAEAVTAGEILTIFGGGMGPASLQTLEFSADGKTVLSALAGTRVLFNGVPGPIVYTSAGQLSVIAPYSIVGAPLVDVQVEYNGVLSNTVTLQAAPAAPGIFTVASSGSGQAAIQNQDYSLNGVSRPATIGSVIIIYATGGGQTLPSAPDGSITAPPFPIVQQSVTVQIDGADAQVLYAGMAPQLVNGVLQINVLIPASLTRGGSLPLSIAIGGTIAQPGVTVAIQIP